MSVCLCCKWAGWGDVVMGGCKVWAKVYNTLPCSGLSYECMLTLISVITLIIWSLWSLWFLWSLWSLIKVISVITLIFVISAHFDLWSLISGTLWSLCAHVIPLLCSCFSSSSGELMFYWSCSVSWLWPDLWPTRGVWTVVGWKVYNFVILSPVFYPKALIVFLRGWVSCLCIHQHSRLVQSDLTLHGASPCQAFMTSSIGGGFLNGQSLISIKGVGQRCRNTWLLMHVLPQDEFAYKCNFYGLHNASVLGG